MAPRERKGTTRDGAIRLDFDGRLPAAASRRVAGGRHVMEARGGVLLYGATGYTGRLIARMAGTYGIRPILAGRSEGPLAVQARTHGMQYRTFGLENPADIQANLAGIRVVLHCAGPFSATAAPMAEACIARGVHYLDITGELDVLESHAARDAQARKAGIMLLPAVGFDVVPTDCLAAHLHARLPSATRLYLAIQGKGRLSRGTTRTIFENQDRGGAIRAGGRIERVPTGWRTRMVDFGNGPRATISIPWGDVATAWRSTGIGDIEVYVRVPAGVRVAMRASRQLGWLLRSKAVRALQQKRLESGAAGPSAEELVRGSTVAWGRVEDGAGGVAEGRLHGPDGYLLTAHAALIIVARVLAGDVKPGFQTPSTAYGPDLPLEIPDVTRVDVHF
jgi:short subunit dehydrogenase-like uncharacterized protein